MYTYTQQYLYVYISFDMHLDDGKVWIPVDRFHSCELLENMTYIFWELTIFQYIGNRKHT